MTPMVPPVSRLVPPEVDGTGGCSDKKDEERPVWGRGAEAMALPPPHASSTLLGSQSLPAPPCPRSRHLGCKHFFPSEESSAGPSFFLIQHSTWADFKALTWVPGQVHKARNSLRVPLSWGAEAPWGRGAHFPFPLPRCGRTRRVSGDMHPASLHAELPAALLETQGPGRGLAL